jgi:hypothetical protein
MEEDIPNGGFPPLYYKSTKEDTKQNTLSVNTKINLEKLTYIPPPNTTILNETNDDNITELNTL